MELVPMELVPWSWSPWSWSPWSWSVESTSEEKRPGRGERKVSLVPGRVTGDPGQVRWSPRGRPSVVGRR
jgi:hypothetical protein